MLYIYIYIFICATYVLYTCYKENKILKLCICYMYGFYLVYVCCMYALYLLQAICYMQYGLYIYIHMLYIFIYIYICICICVCICIYVYMYICIYVHTCMCTYVTRGIQKRLDSSGAHVEDVAINVLGQITFHWGPIICIVQRRIFWEAPLCAAQAADVCSIACYSGVL